MDDHLNILDIIGAMIFQISKSTHSIERAVWRLNTVFGKKVFLIIFANISATHYDFLNEVLQAHLKFIVMYTHFLSVIYLFHKICDFRRNNLLSQIIIHH